MGFLNLQFESFKSIDLTIRHLKTKQIGLDSEHPRSAHQMD